MAAKPGDTIRAPSEKVGQPERRGKIVEILGDQAHPRFRVRWDDGHETVLVPGPDISVESGRKASPRSSETTVT
jgi:hypothetical protein